LKLGELLAEWRRRIDDTVPPYLWSNEEGIAWANQAQREACERALLLEDVSTPAVCNINGQALVGTYPLDHRIIQIKACKWNHLFMTPKSREELNDGQNNRVYRGYGWYGWYGALGEFDWNGPTDWSLLTGQPQFFIDPQERYLTLVRIPVTAAPINLEVYRYPLDEMEDLEDEPEIAHRHHFHLIPWMEKLAFDKRDTETFDPKLRDEKEAEFIGLFGIRPDANVRRQQRARRQNMVKMNSAW
jgi:hypothetical protein